MNLLYLTHAQYVTGGLPKVIEQVEAIANLGHSVTLVTTSKGKGFKIRRFDENGIHYLTTPSVLWGGFRQGADPLDALLRILATRKSKFDVVHAIDSRPTVVLPALYIKKRRKCPLVMEWTDWYGRGGTISERSSKIYASTLGHAETFFEEYFRKHADRAIPISTLLEQRLLSLGYPKENILLQRVGCDTKKFKPQSKSVCRNKLRLPDRTSILCYVGNIYSADLDLLIQSLEILHRDKSRNIMTVLVGGNHDLEPQLVKRLNILLTGRIDLHQLYEYLAAADVCLIPFKQSLANKARWPSKFSDYVNAGCPTVATRVSDYETLFPRHNLGFLADDDTPDSFARAIGLALGDGARLEKIGQACRAYAEKYLDVTYLARERIELYEQALRTNHT